MPRRFATPGRKPSMTICAFFTSCSTTSREGEDFRSRVKLLLLRFSVLNCTGTYDRPGSPRGGSTLITSAPRSAKIAVANGPGTNIEKSTTRTPRSGSQGSAAMPFEVRRRVDDQDLGALAGDDQQMHRVGGKEAGLARLHLELLAADFDVRVAFEQVAHLLDSLVRVRQRALAALELAHQDFHLLRAHGFGPDQTEIPRAGVIGRGVWFYILLTHEVAAHGGGSIQLCSAMPPSTTMEAPVT